jgi:hypothetical protein
MPWRTWTALLPGERSYPVTATEVAGTDQT